MATHRQLECLRMWRMNALVREETQKKVRNLLNRIVSNLESGIRNSMEVWRLALMDYRIRKHSMAKHIFDKLLGVDALAKQRAVSTFRETLDKHRDFLMHDLPNRQKIVINLKRALYNNLRYRFTYWRNATEKLNLLNQFFQRSNTKKIMSKIFQN